MIRPPIPRKSRTEGRMRVPFPLKGFTEIPAHAKVPPGYTSECLNVVGFDVIENKLRGGKRPGTGRAVRDPVKEDGTPVVRLGQITLTADSFVDPGSFFTDPDYTDGFFGFFQSPAIPGFDDVIIFPDDPGEEPDPLPIPPLTAGTLSVTNTTDTTVTLSYTSPQNGEPSYTNTVQQSTGGAFSDTAFTVASGGGIVVVSGLSSSTSYSFRIKTVDSVSTQVTSNTVAAATSVPATFTFEDDFGYSDGNLETASSGLWIVLDEAGGDPGFSDMEIDTNTVIGTRTSGPGTTDETLLAVQNTVTTTNLDTDDPFYIHTYVDLSSINSASLSTNEVARTGAGVGWRCSSESGSGGEHEGIFAYVWRQKEEVGTATDTQRIYLMTTYSNLTFSEQADGGGTTSANPFEDLAGVDAGGFLYVVDTYDSGNDTIKVEVYWNDVLAMTRWVTASAGSLPTAKQPGLIAWSNFTGASAGHDPAAIRGIIMSESEEDALGEVLFTQDFADVSNGSLSDDSAWIRRQLFSALEERDYAAGGENLTVSSGVVSSTEISNRDGCVRLTPTLTLPSAYVIEMMARIPAIGDPLAIMFRQASSVGIEGYDGFTAQFDRTSGAAQNRVDLWEMTGDGPDTKIYDDPSPVPHPAGQYKIAVRVNGNLVSAYVDGQEAMPAQDIGSTYSGNSDIAWGMEDACTATSFTVRALPETLL